MRNLFEKLCTHLPGRAQQPAEMQDPAAAGPGGTLQALYEELRKPIEEAAARGARLEWICAGRDLQPLEWALGGEYLHGGLLNRREWGPWPDEVTLLLNGPEGAEVRTWYWQEGLSSEALETYRALRTDGVEETTAREMAALLTEESEERTR